MDDDEDRNFTFYHIASIVVTLVLLFLFILLLMITSSYVKSIAFTIKTIMKAAFESESPFLAFKSDLDQIRHTRIRREVETNMQNINKESWYFTRYTMILETCKRK